MALADELRQGRTINANGQALEPRGEADASWIHLKPGATRLSTVSGGLPIIEADHGPARQGETDKKPPNRQNTMKASTNWR